jgi:hypothetical protein
LGTAAAGLVRDVRSIGSALLLITLAMMTGTAQAQQRAF